MLDNEHSKLAALLRWAAIAIPIAFSAIPSASAQSLNIDIDMPGAEPDAGGGAPADVFGAAASQPGAWNAIFPGPGPFSLTDLDGALAAATLSISSPDGFSTFSVNNPVNTGDFALLFNDAMSIGSVADGGNATFHFSNLTDGLYQVYTYATPPNSLSGELFIDVVGSNEGTLATSGIMPGDAFALGTTHVIHTIDVTGGEIVIDLTSLPGPERGYINGIQLVMLPAPSGLLVIAAGLLFGSKRRTRCRMSGVSY
jgi:hypothetical protein